MASKDIDDIIKTAHIHVDHIMLRVHVKQSSMFPIMMMNADEDKPKAVDWVGYSNDPQQTEHSLLVMCTGEYPDLVAVADWLAKYESTYGT